MSEAELIHSLNYNSEKLFNVIDTYDNQVYPIKKKDPEKFNKIMSQVYENTHKSILSGKKLESWKENFPNMIDRKIQAEKTKLKKKLKSPKRVKKGKKIYITSQLRNRNILDKMEKLGYYSINTKSKKEKMEAGLKDDEIMADLVEEISDPHGGDHDMVEIMYDNQFKQHIEEYKDRYKYVYAVEDVKPKKKKKDVLIRKDIISVPKKEVELKKKRPIKITPIKKPIKEKIKLFSSIIISENPIKITPAKKLEYIEKKLPIKKKPVIKKKRVVKKKPIKKVPIKKKPPVIKKKPIKKKPVKKKLVVKKKPIIKKKPPVKKLPVKKEKPIKKKPISKTLRVKKRHTPITGRWTARNRIIRGKKRKVKIRRWKGKTQIRIIK